VKLTSLATRVKKISEKGRTEKGYLAS